MGVNNEYEENNESKKTINSRKNNKDYTFNFISGEENMQEVLLKLISSRIDGTYER